MPSAGLRLIQDIEFFEKPFIQESARITALLSTEDVIVRGAANRYGDALRARDSLNAIRDEIALRLWMSTFEELPPVRHLIAPIPHLHKMTHRPYEVIFAVGLIPDAVIGLSFASERATSWRNRNTRVRDYRGAHQRLRTLKL